MCVLPRRPGASEPHHQHQPDRRLVINPTSEGGSVTYLIGQKCWSCSLGRFGGSEQAFASPFLCALQWEGTALRARCCLLVAPIVGCCLVIEGGQGGAACPTPLDMTAQCLACVVFYASGARLDNVGRIVDRARDYRPVQWCAA